MKRKPGEGGKGSTSKPREKQLEAQGDITTLFTSSLTIEETLFAEGFLAEYDDVRDKIIAFNQASDNHDKVKHLCSLQNEMNLVRYDEHHIYDIDDPRLLPEWKWIDDVLEKIGKLRKQLILKVQGDEHLE